MLGANPSCRLFLALVLGYIFAAPVFAQSLAVTSVSSNDTLNLRMGIEEATSLEQTTILARIPHDASDLLGTGRTRFFRGDLWREVRWRGTTGWVHGKFVTLSSLIVAEPNFQCTMGPERYALSFGPRNGAILPGNDEVYKLVTEYFTKIDGSDRHWATAFRVENSEVEFIGIVSFSSACLLDASGTSYGYDLSLVSSALALDGTASFGCCILTN